MKYLLDTDICVYWLKGNEHIEQKVLSRGIDNIAVSFITVSELYYGAYKSQRVDENLAMIRNLTDHINVIESDDAISEAFGNLKASPENAGLIIDDADMVCCRLRTRPWVDVGDEQYKAFQAYKRVKTR